MKMLRVFLIAFASSAVIFTHSFANADVINGSNYRLVTEADLVGFDRTELRRARNEIFARHGYRFNSPDLTSFFLQFSWYQPRTKNVSLSSIEQQNVQFIKSYENNSSLFQRLHTPTQSAATNIGIQQANACSSAVVSVEIDTSKTEELAQEFAKIQKEIKALQALLENQATLASDTVTSEVREIVESELKRLISLRTDEAESVQATSENKYSTPIRPQPIELPPSPRQMAELWPRVPYYVPGSSEVGEFILTSRVSNEGELFYELAFLDPNSSVSKILSSFDFSTEDIQTLRDGLVKSVKNAATLRAKGIIRRYSRSVVCFPEASCEKKAKGFTSNEVLFRMNEDGGTGTHLIRHKGRYPETYGLSTESTALLTSYFDYIMANGSRDFEVRTMSDKDIDALLEE